VTLDRDDIEALAVRVAELLEQRGARRPTGGLVDAAELARRLGTDRSWVYSHAAELGAIRLGSGPKARLRFDPEVAVLQARLGDQDDEPKPKGKSGQRRRHAGSPRKVELLPINGGGSHA
jgi:hypothetical protein